MKTEKEILEESEAAMTKVIEPTNPLQELFINYVGNKLKPEDDEVTVDMCIQVLAEEFPDFLAPVAEQNFFIGYNQAIRDTQQFLEQGIQNDLTDALTKDEEPNDE